MREQDRELGPDSQVEAVHGAPELRNYHCQNMSRDVSLMSLALP